MASGSSGNPGDKPYVVKTLPDDDGLATAYLQTQRDAGFEVLFAVPFGSNMDVSTRVILGNYKGN